MDILEELSRENDRAMPPDLLGGDDAEFDIENETDGDDTGADPVIALVLGWYHALREFRGRRRRVEYLYQRLPDWIRDWPGIYVGDPCERAAEEGITHARSEAELHRYYDRLAQAAVDLDEWDRVEKRRRVAIAELRLTLAAEKGAFRAAGLPFDRETEPAYWAPLFERIEAFERAIARTPAYTVSGLVAKWRHTADYLRLRDEANAGPTARAAMDHVHRMVVGMAEDLERLGLDSLPS